MEKALTAAVTTGVWATLAFAVIVLFRKEIAAAITRIRKVGGAELEAPSQQTAIAVPTPVPEPVPAVAVPEGSLAAGVLDAVVRSTQGMSESERISYLKTNLIATAVATAYEQSNFQIYGSQLQLLIELNSAALPVLRAVELHKRAAEVEPALYALIPFDQWLGWLEKNVRYISNSAGTLSITREGREFLKYIVDRGYVLGRAH